MINKNFLAIFIVLKRTSAIYITVMLNQVNETLRATANPLTLKVLRL